MQGVQEAVKKEEVLVVTVVTLCMYFTFCAEMVDNKDVDPRTRLVLVAAAAAMWMYRVSERDFFRRRNEKE